LNPFGCCEGCRIVISRRRCSLRSLCFSILFLRGRIDFCLVRDDGRFDPVMSRCSLAEKRGMFSQCTSLLPPEPLICGREANELNSSRASTGQ
ncbi:hypothetical protein COCON_G00074840, partial [Conger conger]